MQQFEDMQRPAIRDTESENRVMMPVKRGVTHRLVQMHLRGRRGEVRGVIGGSYVVWAVQMAEPDWKPNDIDVFVKSAEARDHIMREMGAIGYQEIDRSDIAVRMRDYYGHHLPLNIIQGHPEWQRWPDDVFNSFDLSCSRAILLEDGKQALCDVDVAGLRGKVLRVNNPIRSMHRIVKYTARGWTFNERELLKLFLAWDEVPDKRQVQMIANARAAIAAEAAAIAAQAASDEMDTGYDNWHDDDYFEGE